MTRTLDGRTAVITGGASGIGAATARLLAELGASVVVADIVADAADRVADEIVAAGGQAIAVATDVSSEAQVEAMIGAAVDTFGHIDILHNNAAALGAQLSADVDVVSMTVETWDATMAVTLRGVMLGCKYALPHMIEQGSGTIVNTASVAGQTGDLARAAYGSAKAGVLAFTKYVATMYGELGVRANAVSPGLILSPPAIANLSDADLARALRHQLVPRHGQPQDVASAVAFLASDDAGFINGQVVNVDGGTTAHTVHYADNYAGFRARAARSR